MKAILSFSPKLLYTGTPSSSCDQIRRQPHVHHPASLLKPSWKLHAQAKGFGGKREDENPSKLTTRKQVPPPEGNEDDDDQIPQVVFDRMIRRILVSVGLPLVVGVVMLKTLDFCMENHVLEVPRWVPFVTTFLTFGSSVLGIAYGSLSTSWDPDKDGSLLGLEHATQNWTEMWKQDELKK